MYEYKLIVNSSWNYFSEDINGHTSDGWELVGNHCMDTCIMSDKNIRLYFSQMVRRAV